jgi:hypothetical protein
MLPLFYERGSLVANQCLSVCQRGWGGDSCGVGNWHHTPQQKNNRKTVVATALEVNQTARSFSVAAVFVACRMTERQPSSPKILKSPININIIDWKPLCMFENMSDSFSIKKKVRINRSIQNLISKYFMNLTHGK